MLRLPSSPPSLCSPPHLYLKESTRVLQEVHRESPGSTAIGVTKACVRGSTLRGCRGMQISPGFLVCCPSWEEEEGDRGWGDGELG